MVYQMVLRYVYLVVFICCVPGCFGTVGTSCTSDGDCNTTTEVCSGNPGSCQCSSTHYDSSGVCTTKVGLNNQCQQPEACGTINSECSSNEGTCVCSEGFYESNGNASGGSCEPNGNCLQELLHQDNNAQTICFNGNTVCQRTCNDGYVFPDGMSANNFICTNNEWIPPEVKCLRYLNSDYEVEATVEHATSGPFISSCEQVYEDTLTSSLNTFSNRINNLCNFNWIVILSNVRTKSTYTAEGIFRIRLVDSSISNGLRETCIQIIKENYASIFAITYSCQLSSSASATGFTTSTPVLSCSESGYTLTATEDGQVCVPCGQGMFFIIQTRPCQPCPAGQYSSGSTQTLCQKCPDNQQPNTAKTACIESDTPPNPNVSGVQSRTFTVTWSDTNNTKSEDNFGYVVQIKDPSNYCVKEQIYRCIDCTGYFQISLLTSLCVGAVQTILNKTKSSLAGTQTYQPSGLLPDTNYTVTVTAFNSEGRGEVASVTVTTVEEVPKTPTSVQVTDITAKTFIVTWNIEGPKPGKTNFTISVTADPGAPSFEILVIGFDQRSKVIEKLEEYWNYTVSLTALTSIGSMTSDTTQKYRTNAAAPGKVADFYVTTLGPDHRKLRVSWKIPSLLNRNGIITGYRFQHNASDAVVLNAINDTANPEGHIYKEDVSVVPETFYKFEVWAVNHEGEDGAVTQRIMEAPPGVPINTVESDNNPVIPENKISAGKNSLKLTMGQDFFQQESNGKIRATGLIGCETSKRENLKSTMTLAEFNLMDGWAESKKEGFTPYRITPADWTSQSNKNSRKRRQASSEIVYTVGLDDSCETYAFGVYCNGNLNPGTGYIIVAVACTNGGCFLSQQYGPFETYKSPEEAGNQGAVIGGVAGAVAVAAVIAVVGYIVYHRRRKEADPIRSENYGERLEVLNKKQDVSLYRPVLLSNFEAEVKEMHKDCNLMFSTLFKELAAISPKHAQEAATRKENKNKNQDNGILPFDHSRVKLLPSDGHGKDDYINANYLPGYKSPREYIGCQGPIPGTTNDFWRMVWEQNVANIVMLVFCTGGQKAKYSQYWNKECGDRKTVGDLIIELTSCFFSKNNEDRIFNITFRGRKKKVKHFLTLIDLRAERQHDNMVAFINHVRSNVQEFESSEEFSGPTVEHCSTGAGLTGIYIILDHLMQIINENDFNRSINIFKMVYRLRENRPSMIQTEQQLMFIYDCVNVMLESQNTAEYERNDVYEQKGIVQEDEHVYLSINETSPYENTRTQTEN